MNNKRGNNIFVIGEKNTVVLGKRRGPRKSIGNSIYNHGFRQDQLDYTRKILKVRRDNG